MNETMKQELRDILQAEGDDFGKRLIDSETEYQSEEDRTVESHPIWDELYRTDHLKNIDSIIAAGEQRIQKKRSMRRLYTGLAASLLLCLGSLLLIGREDGTTIQVSELSENTSSKYSLGENLQVELLDGSINIFEASRGTLEVTKSENSTAIATEGSVLTGQFAGHDVNFELVSPILEVSVVGTQFRFQFSKDFSEIDLTEGKLRIKTLKDGRLFLATAPCHIGFAGPVFPLAEYKHCVKALGSTEKSPGKTNNIRNSYKRFRLKNGVVYEGTLISSKDGEITVRTKEGAIVNLREDLLVR